MPAGARLVGDEAELARWARMLRKLGGRRAVADLSADLAEETIKIITEGFRDEKDPYGKPWRGPKVFPDGRGLLSGKTGRLRRWHRTKANSAGFRVASTVTYAVYHQGGTGIYGPSRRRIVPRKARALRIPVSGLPGRKGGKKRGVLYRMSVRGAPARPMVPSRVTLPVKWRKAYRNVVRDFASSILHVRL